VPIAADLPMNVRRVRGVLAAETATEAARTVASGGSVIFPTDTVYGIGCAPDDEAAVESVFAAKGRPADKPLAVLLDDAASAAAFAVRLRPGARAAMRHFWPGGLTIIVARAPEHAAAAARGGATIGLRLPDDAICRALLAATGPLAATSANASGKVAYAGDGEALDALPAASMAIIAGPTRRARESTVLDCSGDRIRLVRRGAVDESLIRQALAGIEPIEPT
jgi:L-threonylcarbamoyladenylate synthase